MATFYRGAGIGTYWHDHDARLSGFVAKSSTLRANIDRLMNHIARAVTASPYVSLTRSYGVAYNYALIGRNVPTSEPAFVYELDLPEEPSGVSLVDPIKEIATNTPDPTQPLSYHHDGSMNFLLGVVSPEEHKHFRVEPVLHPPPASGTPRTPNLTIQLETLVRALRDAELLAVGMIPPDCVIARHEVLEGDVS